MGSGVEMRVETAGASVPGDGAAPVRLRLLGPLALLRADGSAVPLPPSRKVRALLAWLAMAPRPASRTALCDLLWDLPADPRGELRWCLSRLRAVFGSAGAARVRVGDDGIALDRTGLDVDALAVAQALQQGLAPLDAAALGALVARFDAGHGFCEGLELPRSPAFDGWLVAQRRRLQAGHAALLEHWAQALPAGSDAALGALERWVAVAPYDVRAHAHLLQALAAAGRHADGEAHLAEVARSFEAEHLDWAPVGLAWRSARQRPADGPRVVVAAPTPPPAAPGPAQRASLVVMPFAERGGGAPPRGGVGEGFARDITMRLAKLRSMFVISPETALTLGARQVGAEDAARRLDVDYVVSGTLHGQPLRVAVQLVQTRTARVVWADEFGGPRADTLAVLDDVGHAIVNAVAGQVELAERNRAILKPPDSLDAWEAYHRGLWHAMRFDPADNEQARRFFEQATQQDPTFSRAWAALSFTHWQDAFQRWHERGPAVEQAYRLASQAMACDELDPSAHWALGRARWLQGRQAEGLASLEASVALSPNFAHGHYGLAFVQSQSGDARRAIEAADLSRSLSPYDPLVFGMLGSRAMALMSLGRHDEAADSALKAAARPNAHVHIQAIAMTCLSLAGRLEEARAVAAAIRRERPGYGVEDLLGAFRFAADREQLVRAAMQRVGWGAGA